MKPTIVILHGWGLSKKTFIPLHQEFEQRGHEVISLDFPGFGETKTPERVLHLDDYAEYLYTFLQKENIKYPVLMGHSFGGRVSLRFSTMNPKSVRALILSGTPGYTPVSRKKLLFFIAIAKIGKSVLSLPTLSFLSETFKKWYYYIVGAKEYYRAQGTMRDTIKNIVSELLIEDMKKVKVPCLLLWGESDIIVPVRIGVKMRDTIPGSIFEMIVGADHGVPFKRPKEFADKVEEFLKKYVY
jgi:pimeloyl-ACP methyl ester carboxylesterase